MRYSFLDSNLLFQETCDCLIWVLPSEQLMTPENPTLLPSVFSTLGETEIFKDLAAKSGTNVRLAYTTDKQIPRILVATTQAGSLTPEGYLKLVDAIQAHLVRVPGIKRFASNLLTLSVETKTEAWKLHHWIKRWSACQEDRSYTMKSEAHSDRTHLSSATMLVAHPHDPQLKICVEETQALCNGSLFACQLANYPANIGTPKKILEMVQEMVDAIPHLLKINVFDQDQLQAEGLNGIIAVAKGSSQPPYLIEVNYRNAAIPTDAPIVFVGKGLTFDSGGISIKPANRMEYMKYDMCGAAAALGLLKTVAQLALPINLTVIVGVCENMPDGDSYRPGDVLTMYNGLSVEILNTDAEGRLVLADALAYAETTHQPEWIIDMATLTGACVVALGHHRSAIFSPNPELAQHLFTASEQSGDLGWVLPMDDAYAEDLESPIADLANCGGRGAGSITAALFLSRFLKNNKKWAHLDIAGTAYLEGKRKRATARPIGLLFQFLKNYLASKKAPSR